MIQRLTGVLGSFVLALAAATASAASAGEAPTVRIGWTAWSDAEFVTRLAERILEERMDQRVALVQTDIAPQYQGVASGDIDVMLMAWLPTTHADYMAKVGRRVTNLGILYDHARLGWIVPDYVPKEELGSITDLGKAAVRARLGGEITGIDPGAGLTRLSREAIQAYGLADYELRIASGQSMTDALARAIDRREWIVVTGWSPHWKFGRWDLRYLDDPEGALGSRERIHAIAREGFYQDNTPAASMLARMYLPIEQLQKYMFEATRHDGDGYEQAVSRYLEEHSERVDYWVTGRM
jgi:glycine betaine/proline transport system substrate-binding protein